MWSSPDRPVFGRPSVPGRGLLRPPGLGRVGLLFRTLGALAILCACAGPSLAGPMQQTLLVPMGLVFDGFVTEYDAETGAFLRNFAIGVDGPTEAIVGADGNFLVSALNEDAINRYDRSTGAFIDVFASVARPECLALFGDTVYTCQIEATQGVRSFDAVTGADTGSFIPTVGGSNLFPRDVAFANGRLYVSYWNLATVEMFDLDTKASLGLLFPPLTGGLNTILGLAFGPDGNLYVSDLTQFVRRYHPTTGQFLGVFADTGHPNKHAFGLAWGRDDNLYASINGVPESVQRFDGETGAVIDEFVPPGPGVLSPQRINFNPPIRRVGIDIRPGNDLNRINPMSRGLIAVALLGSPGFDVDDVDVTTLAFGSGEAPLAHRNGPHPRDIDRDGFPELLAHFRTEDSGIAPGDSSACLTGTTFGGTLIEGCDTILTGPACGLGMELVLVLPPLAWLKRRRGFASEHRSPASTAGSPR